MRNSRKFDVFIEDQYTTDQRTGLRQRMYSLEVWADADMGDIITSVDGVTKSYNTLSPTRYNVYIDHRYDIDTIRENIEFALLDALTEAEDARSSE